MPVTNPHTERRSARIRDRQCDTRARRDMEPSRRSTGTIDNIVRVTPSSQEAGSDANQLQVTHTENPNLIRTLIDTVSQLQNQLNSVVQTVNSIHESQNANANGADNTGTTSNQTSTPVNVTCISERPRTTVTSTVCHLDSAQNLDTAPLTVVSAMRQPNIVHIHNIQNGYATPPTDNVMSTCQLTISTLVDVPGTNQNSSQCTSVGRLTQKID